uniref:BED-type domain-containing protein n=1 Tax=Salix viminalis TaxID=40686 RepID=A0A6N2K815_SALVM
MAENSSSCGTSMYSAPTRSDDPAWAHGQVVPGVKNASICIYCNKRINGGGVTRLKYHLAGIKGEVEACKKVPPEVKWQMKQMKERRKRIRTDIGNSQSASNDEEIAEGDAANPRSQTSRRTTVQGTSTSGRRIPLFAPRTTPGSQPSIRSAMATKEMEHNARIAVATWWYDANIPFNSANSYYYQPMLDAVASIGPGFKGPSFHDLRGPLLKDVVHHVHEYILSIKADWRVYGCSIMADGWTNVRNAPIVNFLAYSPRGTVFLKSVDTSGLRKDKETLLEMFDEVVKEVGQENIVQFVSDNEASFKAAGKALQQRYGTFFWSPCAAHCIDLMLENICDPRYFPMIDETIKKARNITKFIYNHAWVLALMRKEFTNGHDLCRPGITRFATHFLSLQCLLKFKKELRQMFTCTKWVESSHGKSRVGKEIAAIILQDNDFWPRCAHIINVSEPLVRVLRLADSEEKPSMGYLYEAMDKAKEAIKIRLKNRMSQYGPYIRVIDARWDKQLHSPLHAAGCFLNPGIYFRPSFSKQREVTRGLLTTIMRLVPDCDTQDNIMPKLRSIREQLFHGGSNSALILQNFKSLQFEFLVNAVVQLGAKEIGVLEHKRLNDLVFVRYNLKIQQRNMSRTRDALDPISLDNIDLLNEWICEEPGLLDGDDISWESIEAPFATLNLDDDEACVNEENELGGDDQLLECLVDDFPYVPQPDQDPYFYINDVVEDGNRDWSLTIDGSSFVGCRRPGHVASNGRMEDACEFLVGTITCKLHQVGPPWQLCKRLQPLPQSNLAGGS